MRWPCRGSNPDDASVSFQVLLKSAALPRTISLSLGRLSDDWLAMLEPFVMHIVNQNRCLPVQGCSGRHRVLQGCLVFRVRWDRVRQLPGLDGGTVHRQLPSVQETGVPAVGVARFSSTDPANQPGPCQVEDCRPDDGPADPVRQVDIIQVGGVKRSGPRQPIQDDVLNPTVPSATMGPVQVVCGVPSDAFASMPRPLRLAL